MNKLKHSKYKNTAFLFEVLSRKVVSESLDIRKPTQTAIHIIRKHFYPGSILLEELELYNQVIYSTRNKSIPNVDKYLDLVIESRHNLNTHKLKSAKFNLIKELKRKYGDSLLNDMFNINIPQYREIAAAYKLFEYSSKDNPLEIHQSKNTLCEYLNSSVQTVRNSWESLSAKERDIAFQRMIDLFNDKYKNLNKKQRDLLSIYINNQESLKEYVQTESVKLKGSILKCIDNISESTLKIKLQTVTDYLDKIRTENKITDDHVSVILKYYALESEIKKYG